MLFDLAQLDLNQFDTPRSQRLLDRLPNARSKIFHGDDHAFEHRHIVKILVLAMIDYHVLHQIHQFQHIAKEPRLRIDRAAYRDFQPVVVAMDVFAQPVAPRILGCIQGLTVQAMAGAEGEATGEERLHRFGMVARSPSGKAAMWRT